MRKSDEDNSCIPTHQGFKFMVEFLQNGKGNDAVRAWTRKEEEVTVEMVEKKKKRKMKSYVQLHVGTNDINTMSKTQLQTLCHALQKVVDETKPIRSTYVALQGQLANAEDQIMSQDQLLQATRAALRTVMAQLWDETGSPGPILYDMWLPRALRNGYCQGSLEPNGSYF
jgi:hypothetical protein